MRFICLLFLSVKPIKTDQSKNKQLIPNKYKSGVFSIKYKIYSFTQGYPYQS